MVGVPGAAKAPDDFLSCDPDVGDHTVMCGPQRHLATVPVPTAVRVDLSERPKLADQEAEGRKLRHVERSIRNLDSQHDTSYLHASPIW